MELDPVMSSLLKVIRRNCPDGWWANSLDFFRIDTDDFDPSMTICVFCKNTDSGGGRRPGLDFLISVREGKLLLTLSLSNQSSFEEEIADLGDPKALERLKKCVKNVAGELGRFGSRFRRMLGR